MKSALALVLLTASIATAAEPLTPAETDFVARSKIYTKQRMTALVASLRKTKASQMPRGDRVTTLSRIQREIDSLRAEKLVPSPLRHPLRAGDIGALPSADAAVVRIIGPRTVRLRIGEPEPNITVRTLGDDAPTKGLDFGSAAEVRQRNAAINRENSESQRLTFTLDDIDTADMKVGERVKLPQVVEVDSAATEIVRPFDAGKLLGKPSKRD